MDKNTKLKLNAIGIYQITGGLIGLYYFILAFSNLGYYSFIMLPAFCVYLFTICCGYLLLKGNYQKGINISIYNQALQIIAFGVLGIGYMYVAGLYVAVKLDLTNDFFLGIDFDLSHLKFNFNSEYDRTYLSINIIPIIILHYLFKIRKTVESKEVESRIESL